MKRIQLQLTNKRKERHTFTLDLVRVNSNRVRVTVLDPGYKLRDANARIVSDGMQMHTIGGNASENRLEVTLNNQEMRNIAIVPSANYTKNERYFVIVSGALAARG
jgi:hypothetical protein